MSGIVTGMFGTPDKPDRPFESPDPCSDTLFTGTAGPLEGMHYLPPDQSPPADTPRAYAELRAEGRGFSSASLYAGPLLRPPQFTLLDAEGNPLSEESAETYLLKRRIPYPKQERLTEQERGLIDVVRNRIGELAAQAHVDISDRPGPADEDVYKIHHVFNTRAERAWNLEVYNGITGSVGRHALHATGLGIVLDREAHIPSTIAHETTHDLARQMVVVTDLRRARLPNGMVVAESGLARQVVKDGKIVSRGGGMNEFVTDAVGSDATPEQSFMYSHAYNSAIMSDTIQTTMRRQHMDPEEMRRVMTRALFGYDSELNSMLKDSFGVRGFAKLRTVEPRITPEAAVNLGQDLGLTRAVDGIRAYEKTKDGAHLGLARWRDGV